MRLYAAFDLHSSNSYVGISDEKGKRIFKKKLHNDPARIKETLKPFKAEIEGIVVESTYTKECISKASYFVIPASAARRESFL